MSNPNQPLRYDLLQIIDIMKTNKVLKVQLGTMIVELSPSAFVSEVVDLSDMTVEQAITNTQSKLVKDKLEQDETVSMPSDGDMMFWSSGDSNT